MNFVSDAKISDSEIKVEIMYRLDRKGCWGARYLPSEALVSWLGKKVKRNGKRVRKLIDDLVKGGYLLQHKKGRTVSLNPRRSREIAEHIAGNVSW